MYSTPILQEQREMTVCEWRNTADIIAQMSVMGCSIRTTGSKNTTETRVITVSEMAHSPKK